jgi:peptide/nickel transport system substrate-binding protein
VNKGEKFMKRFRGVLALTLGALLAAAAVLAGCGGGSGSSADGGSDSAAAKPGGVLHFGLESEPTTLNPTRVVEQATSYVIPQINETLFEIDSEGEAQPKLATKYTTSKDGLTWTLQLRKGVKFSDGAPMTADDVVFSIEEARTGPYFAGLYEPIEKVRATSPTTVVIETSEPMPALIADLSIFTIGIVPENYGGVAEKEFGQSPVGTGPFVLESWKHGQAITLAKNPGYWDQGQPLLDEIVYTVTTNENARAAQLRGGDLDATRVSPLTVKSGLSGVSDVQLDEVPGGIVNLFSLNLNWPPFDDQRIREAINLAIDREGINQAGSDGKGTLGASFLQPSILYSDTDLQPPARDVEKAKELVAEAVKDGVDTSFTIKFTNFTGFFPITAQIIQQNLEEVGLAVKLETLDEAALSEESTTGKGVPAGLGLTTAWLNDPAELASFYLFGAEFIGSDMKKLTKLANEANVEMNPTKREQLYHEMQEAVAEEELTLVLNYEPIIMATQDNVTGIRYTPTGLLTLGTAGFTD